MVHDVELIVFIGVGDFFEDLFQTEECPFIEFGHILVGNSIFRRVEVGQVAQEIAEGIADLAVDVGELFQDLRRQADIALVVSRRNPQAEDIGTVFFDDFLGSYGVADGFTHLAAFAVDGKAVGQDRFIRSVAVDGHGR